LRWSFRVTESKPDGFIIEAFGDFVGRGEWTLTRNGTPNNRRPDPQLASMPLTEVFFCKPCRIRR
jgi:hypothetical protein